MPRFDELPLAVQEAMSTPFHLILPADVPLATSIPNIEDTTAAGLVIESNTGTGALYLGSLAAVVDPCIDTLRSLHISHIVQVMDLPWLVLTPEEGFDCYKFPIKDLPTQKLDSEMLERVCGHIDKLRNEGKNVLVHCQQGVSRSATVVIAYIMRRNGLNLAEALAFTKSKRACVKPNPGFMNCLRIWEQAQIF